MRNYEERLAERAARRADRMHRMEVRRAYNREMMTTLSENFLENALAVEEDAIANQKIRQMNTATWFPRIADSMLYRTVTDHNIDRHELRIKKLQSYLNGTDFNA